MKTIDEIIANYAEYETPIEDRFGRRFTTFLTQEQGAKICFVCKDGCEWPEPKAWTRENILEQLKEDVAFGFEKALNERGISSGLMFDVVLKWNKVLEEGLENYNSNDYEPYGIPLFKATAEKYGFENPIEKSSNE